MQKSEISSSIKNKEKDPSPQNKRTLSVGFGTQEALNCITSGGLSVIADDLKDEEPSPFPLKLMNLMTLRDSPMFKQ